MRKLKHIMSRMKLNKAVINSWNEKRLCKCLDNIHEWNENPYIIELRRHLFLNHKRTRGKWGENEKERISPGMRQIHICYRINIIDILWNWIAWNWSWCMYMIKRKGGNMTQYENITSMSGNCFRGFKNVVNILLATIEVHI